DTSFYYLFFFSSRRRHTRFSRDWSSDMCSSDLYDDPRATIVIADGKEFVAQCQDTFDVIIADSTDPIGPAEVLFTADFYKDEKTCLNPGGIMVRSEERRGGKETRERGRA